MKEKHGKPNKKYGLAKDTRERKPRAKAEGREAQEFTEVDVISHLAERKQTREILSMTNAAVEALNSARTTEEDSSSISGAPQRDFSGLFEKSLSESITTDERDVLNLPDGSSTSQDGRTADGSSRMENSFNGVQRVRVPSRLLREIPSPLERSGASDDARVQAPAPVVIRHANAPSAWVSTATTSPVSRIAEHAVRTHAEPTSTTMLQSHVVTEAADLEVAFPHQRHIPSKTQTAEVLQEKSIKTGKQQPMEQLQSDEEVINNGDISPRPHRTSRQTDGRVLCQGDPVTGMLTNSQRSLDHIKVKSFSLNERERLLKEEFMKRQDRKSAPIKRVVQPTLVLPQATQAPGSGTTKGSQADNPVVSAAAIAAAAASAATAPFLQIQHGLESQIGALVSTMQVLQSSQDRSHQQQRQEQERELQHKIDVRLKRLEEIQQQMLDMQAQQLSSRPGQPDIRHGMHHHPVHGMASYQSKTHHPLPYQQHPHQHPSQSYPSKFSEHSVPLSHTHVAPTQHTLSHQQQTHQHPSQSYPRMSNAPSVLPPHTCAAQHPIPHQQPPYQHPSQSCPSMSSEHCESLSHTHVAPTQHPIPDQQPPYQHPSQSYPSMSSAPSVVPSHTHSTQHPINTHPSMHREPVLSHEPSVPPPHPLAAPTQHPIITHPSVHREHVVYGAPPEQPSEGRQSPRQERRSPRANRSRDQGIRANTSAKDKARITAVKNTKTQTSPQESYMSGDSPLQTPLPRKRPPVPISRSDLLRSHTKGRPVGGGERRVHFDDDDDHDYYREPTYSERKARKARAILEELLGTRDERRTQPVPINPPQPRLETTQPTQRREAQAQQHQMQRQQQAPVMPSPLTTETRAMLDDLGRISTELKTVMSEAEKLKGDLKVQKYDGGFEAALSRQSHGPSPLDAYLATERKPTLYEPQNPKIKQAPTLQHYVDAEHILRDVQTRRHNLEANLASVLRQRDEENLYTLVDHMMDADKGVDEVLRIRKDVDKKIKELSSAVQREIEIEKQKTKETPEPVINQKQPLQKQKPNRGIPSRGGDRKLHTSGKKPPPKRIPGKENGQAETQIKARRTKVTKTQPSGTKSTPKPAPSPAASKPAPLSAATRESYLTSVYGRQPYHPQRTTSKAAYLHYQSPVNPRTAAITAALLDRQTPAVRDTHPPPQHMDESMHVPGRSHKRPVDNDQFYFHPATDVSNIVPTGEGSGKIGAPVEGHLVPIAVPLGKPKTDPSLRLPLATFAAQGDTSLTVETMLSHQPPASTPKSKTSALTRPNVAVINIREEGVGDESDHRRKRRKEMDKKKKQGRGLGVQILPKVDIDSFTESSSSVTTPREPAHISTIQRPITRPDESEYEELMNYIAVRDTDKSPSDADDGDDDDDDDDDDEKTRLPSPDDPMIIRGDTQRERLYHGPAFPPEHPPLPSNPAPGVIEADNRVSDALEDRAVEWIEQELLARIVSEMNRPLPDPTAMSRPRDPTPESSITSESDDGGVLAATIGLGGVQLFIDAGVPVDRDLVAELIKDVITDQIAATLGYPKPTATPRTPEAAVMDELPESQTSTPRGTPLATPVPTPVYTPPESDASERESPKVVTPALSPTPSGSSVSEKSVSTVEEQTPVKEMTVEEEKSQSEPEISEVHSPLPTPVATPSGPQTPAVSVSTPQPSVREPEVSEVGSLVSTPQSTAKTPTPPPEPSIISELSKTETPPPPSALSISTPPEPQVTLSPSSIATTTLSEGTSTTLTTEDDLSQGQLIQPYVHVGQFSEGEYAVAPGVLELARERNLPTDWDAGMLGADEDSRNDLIRTALHGLLRRGKEGGPLARVRADRGSSSSSETSEPTSMASTLRDTTDIREDSLADASPSEGEIILPRDPSAAHLISQITRSSRPSAAQESEGEITSDVIGSRTNRVPTTIKPSKGSGDNSLDISPGELRSARLSDSAIQSPGEINTNRPRRSSSAGNIPAPGALFRGTPKEAHDNSLISNGEHGDDTQSRSLHTSDLGKTRKERVKPQPAERRAAKPRIIEVDIKNDHKSLTHSGSAHPNDEIPALSTPSSDVAPARDEGNGGKLTPDDDVDGDSPQAQPTRIHVTIPLMDMHESSVNSDGAEHGNEDTFGDVSSISGGDF